MNTILLLSALGGGLGWIVMLVLGVFVFIAPIAIWWNTGKITRLLSLQLRLQGVDKELLEGVVKNNISPVYDDEMSQKSFGERVAEAAK